MTHSAADIARLIERHGLTPNRALGQNFVIDPNTVRKIAHLAAVGPGDRVIEVGAGLGSLTLALAETGAHVIAVELDRHLIPVLREVVESVGVRVVQADVLELDWATELGADDAVLVANLPYNLAATIVLDVAERAPSIGRMLVMVQREVAERLVAGPGSRVYGIPSVKVAYWGRAKIVGRVGPSVFLPRPNVESALVAIERHHVDSAPGREVDRGELFAVIDQAFAQRRKMLRRSLGARFDARTFERAAISGELRPENLSIEDWVRLVDSARSVR